MAGIYTRDNFAQLLANAIENAQARRQAYVDREAQRTKENAGAIANFAKALGRTYETWDGVGIPANAEEDGSRHRQYFV